MHITIDTTRYWLCSCYALSRCCRNPNGESKKSSKSSTCQVSSFQGFFVSVRLFPFDCFRSTVSVRLFPFDCYYPTLLYNQKVFGVFQLLSLSSNIDNFFIQQRRGACLMTMRVLSVQPHFVACGYISLFSSAHVLHIGSHPVRPPCSQLDRFLSIWKCKVE